MKRFITVIPDSAVTTAFMKAVNDATATFEDFKVNISADEKVGKRSMAEGREGYVRMVSKIANQHPDGLSRADNPTDMVAILDYYDSVSAVRMALLKSLETIDDTVFAAALDIMNMADRYVQNLQISRKTDGTLDYAMREVDDFNKRFGPDKTKPTPPDSPEPPVL
jgi:hypothetical protein